MASRRLRIKAVTNLPIRRGKGSDQVLSEPPNVNTNTEVDPQLIANEISTSKDPEPDKLVAGTEASKLGTICDDGSSSSTSSVAYNVNSSGELQACENTAEDEQLKREEPPGGSTRNKSGSEDVQGNETSEEPEATSNKSLLRFSRKRVKPPVSLSIATRRPRENKELTTNGEKRPDQPALGDSAGKENEAGSSNFPEICEVKENASTANNITTTYEPIIDDNTRTSPHVSGHKGILSVPGVTRLIPTGTAIRPQQSKSIDDDRLSVTSEAPQSLPEANLPSEGASGESFSPCKLPRPTPLRVDVRSRSVQGSGASASESEDDCRKSVSSASTVIHLISKKSETMRPRFRRPNIMNVARRNSLQGSGASASESEDDLKKPLSVATTLSFHGGSVRDVDSDDSTLIAPSKEIGTSEVAFTSKEWKKTIRRTDTIKTTRRNGKMNERMMKAKKEFLSKSGGHVPDRSSLTMFDLIYYNPTTNPMKSAVEKGTGEEGQVIGERSDDTVEERLVEEAVDEPGVQEDEVEEEEVAMPVPRVKVGPDGQIILDEQSLVIETTGSKKNREDLANSAVVVDYGMGSATYGTYSKKKNKRRKEWPESETLRFYRALQTLGTDFLLMQSIFPKLSRQDLKAKFKKEEKMNRALVEKALRYPLKFDLTALELELQHQLENEENNIAKASEQKKERVKKEKGVREKKHSSSPKSLMYKTLNKDDDGVIRNKRKRSNKTVKTRKHPKMRADDHSSSSSEADEIYEDAQSGISCFVGSEAESQIEELDSVNGEKTDSESETDEMKFLSKSPQATRSGRLTKPRILTDITQDERNASRSKHEKVQNNVIAASSLNSLDSIPNTFSHMEPGSLFVLASESPLHPGQQIIQVFMVSPHNVQNSASARVPISTLPSVSVPVPPPPHISTPCVSLPASVSVHAPSLTSMPPSVSVHAPSLTSMPPSVSVHAPISAHAPSSIPPQVSLSASAKASSCTPPHVSLPAFAHAPSSTPPHVSLPASENAPSCTLLHVSLPDSENAPSCTPLHVSLPDSENAPSSTPPHVSLLDSENTPSSTPPHVFLPASANAPSSTPPHISLPASTPMHVSFPTSAYTSIFIPPPVSLPPSVSVHAPISIPAPISAAVAGSQVSMD